MKISTRESGIPRSDEPYSPEWALQQVKTLGLDATEFSTLPPPRCAAARGVASGPGRNNADEILMVGKHLSYLHHSFIDPETDYPAMFAALEQVGYNYAWVFECNAEELPRSKQKLDALLAKYW